METGKRKEGALTSNYMLDGFDRYSFQPLFRSMPNRTIFIINKHTKTIRRTYEFHCWKLGS